MKEKEARPQWDRIESLLNELEKVLLEYEIPYFLYAGSAPNADPSFEHERHSTYITIKNLNQIIGQSKFMKNAINEVGVPWYINIDTGYTGPKRGRGATVWRPGDTHHTEG